MKKRICILRAEREMESRMKEFRGQGISNGIAVGRVASGIVSAQMGWPVSTSVSAMVLSVSVAAVIGIVFGWYPAWKGSRLDPIDALRHE
jgi:ABC-type antimicrobial peptide transport system permease subunit